MRATGIHRASSWPIAGEKGDDPQTDKHCLQKKRPREELSSLYRENIGVPSEKKIYINVNIFGASLSKCMI